MLEGYLSPERVAYYQAKGYWKGETIGEYLERSVEHFPDKIAVVDSHARLTWKQLRDEVDAFALSLLELGVTRQDRVCLQLPNWYEFTVSFCALSKIGAIPIPLNPALREAEVSFILTHSEAVAIILASEFGGYNYVEMIRRIRSQTGSLRHVIVVDRSGREWPDTISYAQMVRPDILGKYGDDYLLRYRPCGDDVNVILYTSGTTGNPKGVMFTHNIHDYDTKSFVRELNITSGDVILFLSPIAHQLSIAQGMYPAFYTGARMVLLEKFDPVKALEMISTEQCTFLIGPAPTLMGLLEAVAATGKGYKDSSVRVFFSGGAHLPPQVVGRAKELLGCQVINGYGMTEVAAALMTRLGDADEVVSNTVGRPFPPSLEVKIVGEDGKEVGDGETGEILFRGPSIFIGYYKNQKANQESFREGGWFGTGDLARKRPDGNLVIMGRKKDMINRGGQSIYPEEIEDLLLEHPKISRCAMVGMPDARLGERNCLFVVPKPGAEITLDEINSYLLHEKRVAKFKLPERLEVVENLPMLPTGKILKRELKEIITEKLKREGIC